MPSINDILTNEAVSYTHLNLNHIELVNTIALDDYEIVHQVLERVKLLYNKQMLQDLVFHIDKNVPENFSGHKIPDVYKRQHYVCPKNLKTVHDKLLKIKQEREAKLRQERNRAQSISKREKLMKDIAGFYERMEKFFGLRIEEEDIIIRPLESVTQFYQEGKMCIRDSGLS